MELKLNIYGRSGEVVKTYTANDFTLKTGVCEDVMELVDIDKLTSGNISNQMLGVEIIKIVAKSFNKIKPFMQDIFEGLTDEEYRNTSLEDVGKVVISVVKFTINRLYSVGGNSKN